MASFEELPTTSGPQRFDAVSRVEEVVTDILTMDLLHSSPAFLQRVLELAGAASPSEIVSIRRSVSDTSMGETDVELVIQLGSKRQAILIENKIRAPVMDRQFERYRMRGNAGKASGQWDDFCVILMSPQSYFDELDAEQKEYVDANLSYEMIVEFLASFSEHAFKRHIFQSAVAQFKKGYVRIADARMISFHQNYWALASAKFPQLRMMKPDVVGSDGSWIYFPPLYGDTNKVRLIHKFKGIGCELSVTTRRAEEIATALEPHLDVDMVVRSMKTAAYINIKTPALDHLAEFSVLESDLLISLQQLDRLRLFALNENVRGLINQHI
ncbi:hypothetical protein HPO_01962 [Hyphomonas polymorpha PS728]|uniref:PD-(D/E)XK nuclease superfamily protein n=2 Tax=Hyphomonas polymorpha TaxID=74319 RepID=A0A062VN36_9PROT|nr:hypothetical protein HPO_01962 [Hyphomonas polymorpha PS728]